MAESDNGNGYAALSDGHRYALCVDCSVFQKHDGANMQMDDIPFGTTDWATIEPTEHKGEQGLALWRTRQFGNIRVRMVDYTPGYLADHWCTKGHILFCIEGELHTELADGRRFVLKPGMSYQVADNAEPHRSCTEAGARLFIVD
jgi:quercetin dioxygenase-like cupin family protein